MANNENLIPIPGRLHSVTTDGITTGADEIFDDTQQKDQETINSELIAAVGTGGSVDSRIAAAKAEIIGNATSACDTLGEAEALISAEASARQSADTAIDGRVDTLEEAVGSGGSVDSRIASAVATETSRAQAAEALKANSADVYTKTETYTKTEVNGLVDTPHQEYKTVDAYANLPATGSKDTIYRVSNYNGSTNQVDASVYSEYAWDGNQYVFLCVKSQIGEVFDISVYNNNAKYADLAAALNGGANIPQSLQKGGMSVKFVQSSDNKYVQYRLMSDTFTTDVTQWQGVDDEPTAGSENLVKSGGVAECFHKLNLVDAEGVETQDYTDLQQGYISKNGTWSSNIYFRYVKFDVQEGDVITCDGEGLLRIICAYNGNTAIEDSGASHVFSYTVPSGINKIAASVRIDGTVPPTKIICSRVVAIKLPRQVVTNTEDINELNNNVQEIDNVITDLNIIPYEDIESEDYTNLNQGYRDKNNTWNSGSAFKYVYIEVGEGDVITADKEIRFVCAYNGTTVLPDYGYNNVWLSSYTVPSGVNKVAVSAVNTVTKFTRTYLATKELPSQVLQNMRDVEGLTKDDNNIFLNMIKSPFVIGWAEEGYYTLGRAIASRRLGNELSSSPLVNIKLGEIDAYPNVAGYCIYNGGYIYILKHANHVADASNGEVEYMYIVKIDPSNGSIVNQIRLFYDEDITVDGESYHCAREYQGAFVVGDKIKVIAATSTKAEYDITATNTVICATINKDTFVVEEYEKCYIQEDGASTPWINNGRIDPLVSQFSELYNGYYYGVCKTVSTKKYAIVKTADLVTFEVVAYVPTTDEGLSTYGEFGIDCKSNFCHIACRVAPFSGENGTVQTSSSSLVILKYDMRNWKMVKAVKVLSGMSMSTFFRHSNNLYNICCGVYNQRNYYRFIKIDEDYLENSRAIADENNNIVGANTIVASDGTYLYACKTGVNLVVLKFHLPSFTRQEADTISDFLISQLT